MGARKLLAALILLSGCGGHAFTDADEGDPPSPPPSNAGGAPAANEDGGESGLLAPGMTARVTAASLNLRDGVGTAAMILTSMPCGAQVTVTAGPSTSPSAGWWNVIYDGQAGWASGSYLIPDGSFSPALCGAGVPPAGTPTGNTTIDDIFARAKLAVGYSYYWGHGSWRSDGAQPGACMGSCPSCTHSASTYGADCSGFVAKVWQVPSVSALEVDQHPYSTANFYGDTTHWKPIPRSSLKPGDALVYRSGTSGHIALFEVATDPFGQLWLYEARGCSTGVVHDLRTVDSSYIAIRRDGL